jgi:hypothetical protein
MEVSLTWLAKWQIKRRGGQLWIWLAPVSGSGNALIRASTSEPSGIEFEYIEQDRLFLWVSHDFPVSEFEVGWNPIIGFDVTWAGTPAGAGG